MVDHRPYAEVSVFPRARRAGSSVRRRPRPTRLLLLVALLLALLPAAPPARAAGNCTVSTTVDNATTPPVGSLREALADPGCTTIDFALPGTGPWTISVTSKALPVIGRDLTVTGPGADRLTIDGGGALRVLTVFGGTVNLAGLTLAHGHQTSTAIPGGGLHVRGGAVTLTGVVVRDTVGASGDGSTGGGIYVQSPGNLTLVGSTLAGNTAGLGGGLYSTGGTVTLTNSTVSGNTAGSYAGRIYSTGGTVTLTNSTVSGNAADGYGGGLYHYGGTVTLKFATITGNTSAHGGGIYTTGGGSLAVLSSIVAGNRRDVSNPDDCDGTISSQGRNLWGDQTLCPNNGALLDRNLVALNKNLASVLNTTLADNGGPTKTHNLVTGGAAIDTGDNVACPATDQRGVARPQGAGCDIGAVEYTAAPPSPSPSASPSLSPSPSPAPSTGPAPSFADVPVGYWAHDQIVTFARRGITTGCGDNDRGQRLYCPERGVTRAEMATFLTRALGQDQQAPPATPTFADVPSDYWAYGQIEAFVKLGITTGCGTDDLGRRVFCPDRGVTRAEMAAFLDRAKSQTELANPAPTFADVPPSYWAYGWIERFFTLGVTTGCGTDDQGHKVYCPDRGVTRAEMAVFIIRAYP